MAISKISTLNLFKQQKFSGFSAANSSVVGQPTTSSVEYLIVAGGGGSGGSNNGARGSGGGGAGGYLTGTSSVVFGTSYTITVGSGGPAGIEFYHGSN
jgi:hypothetical protein